MTNDQHEPPIEDDARAIALERAISAAENAMQATAQLWEMLTPAERDRWLEQASVVWPRRDVALKPSFPPPTSCSTRCARPTRDRARTRLGH